jgi:hypothetical protein
MSESGFVSTGGNRRLTQKVKLMCYVVYSDCSGQGTRRVGSEQ